MRSPAAVFTIALALGAISLVRGTGAQAQNAREGSREIEECQTISQPGSYKLVKNLTATGDCIVIAAESVTLDLAGFSITGSGASAGTAIGLPPQRGIRGIAVRNGTSQALPKGSISARLVVLRARSSRGCAFLASPGRG